MILFSNKMMNDFLTEVFPPKTIVNNFLENMNINNLEIKINIYQN